MTTRSHYESSRFSVRISHTRRLSIRDERTFQRATFPRRLAVKRRYLPALVLSLIATVACGGSNEASDDDTGKGGSGITHTGGSGGSSASANGGTGNIMIVQGGSAGTGGTSGVGGGQAC